MSSPLREYVLTINGVETTAQLSDADAKRLGARPVSTPDTASASTPDVAVAAKTRQPPNKARTAADK